MSVAVGQLTGQDKRTAECLRLEVENLARAYGVNRLGFLTLTFKNQVTTYKGAQAKWHSLVTNELKARYPRIIATWERDKKRKVHWHAVVVLPFDAGRETFNFEALRTADREFTACGKSGIWHLATAAYRASANPALLAEWAWLRKTLPRFGFGRHRLEPVKGEPIALARYCAKYIAKQLSGREPGDKGAQRVRYIGFLERRDFPARGLEPARTGVRVSTRSCSVRFGWNSVGARVWRAKVAEWADHGNRIEPSELWLETEEARTFAKAGAWKWRNWQFQWRATIQACEVGAYFWEREDEAALGVEVAIVERRQSEAAVRRERDLVELAVWRERVEDLESFVSACDMVWETMEGGFAA